MAWISTCPYHSQFHPAFLEFLKRKSVQFCADPVVLVLGMDCETLDFPGLGQQSQ